MGVECNPLGSGRALLVEISFFVAHNEYIYHSSSSAAESPNFRSVVCGCQQLLERGPGLQMDGLGEITLIDPWVAKWIGRICR